MKISQILGLPQFYQSITEKKLPFSLAYKFNKLAAQVNTELDFYGKEMTKIIDEYGEKNPDGSVIYLDNGDVKIIPELREQCMARIQELQDVDVSIDITFSPAELESLEMSIRELQNLVPFIKD